jgi:uncharacterized membrane protein HdeD (DUF308 family)
MNENASLDRETGAWWLLLITGTLWILFGFMLLTFSYKTVWGIAVFAGIGFLACGTLDLMMAFVTRRYRWTHVLFGLIGILAGIASLAWPAETFIILARIFAWFLFIGGLASTIMAIATHRENELWWLQLIVGGLSLAIGVWAVRNISGSLVLLALWAGIGALCRGLSDLVVGFGLHGERKSVERAMRAPQPA